MKKIVVLMSSYNGEKFIVNQIESILNQKNVDVNLIVRDDGSTDSTHKILTQYQDANKLTWYYGENLKSAYSFLNLIDNAPEADFFAFSDQDDVWNENKLINAINQIEKKENIHGSNIPILYCSNYQLVDENLINLKDNNHVTTTKFNEAIVSSCCTGCTMVFNKELCNLIKNHKPQLLVMHDDWIHKVCLAVGGIVIFDNTKTLKYRQHGNNVDAGVHSLKHRILQIYKRIKTGECIRSKQLDELLRIYYSKMDEQNINLLKKLTNYRKKNIIQRIKLAFFSEYKTIYKKKNRGFGIAIILKYF